MTHLGPGQGPVPTMIRTCGSLPVQRTVGTLPSPTRLLRCVRRSLVVNGGGTAIQKGERPRRQDRRPAWTGPEIILAPGPTPIPPEVLLAQGARSYHRGPGFGRLMRDVTSRLKELYRTSSGRPADDVLGTGGLESAVQNVFSPGDEVLVPWPGSSHRWRNLATAMGLTVRVVEHEWGRKVDPSRVADALAERPAKAILLTQSETSTGVIQPVEELARVANDAGALVIADVVSSLGAVPFAFDDWGIDVAVGGSQKALSASPGSRSSRSASVPGRRTSGPRCPASTSTGRSIAGSPSSPTRRTRGRRRSA